MTRRQSLPKEFPCPWCGKKPWLDKRYNHGRKSGYEYFVRCSLYCGVKGPYKLTERGAINAWNNVAFTQQEIREARQERVSSLTLLLTYP
mgnify:CR=1 FL=1